MEVLLPISISLKGCVRNEVALDTLYQQGWTVDHDMMKCIPPEPEETRITESVQ